MDLASVTWVGVDKTKLIIKDGGELSWFASTIDSQRGFCRECGSTLFFRSERWFREIHIARANITSGVDIEPTAHSYWDAHVSWFEFRDELKKK